MPGHGRRRIACRSRTNSRARRSACNGNGTIIPTTPDGSLSARPGFLRLEAGPADHLVTARNTLTQILQGPEATITTRLDIPVYRKGSAPGWCCSASRYRGSAWCARAASTHVVTAQAGVETAGPEVAGSIVAARRGDAGPGRPFQLQPRTAGASRPWRPAAVEILVVEKARARPVQLWRQRRACRCRLGARHPQGSIDEPARFPGRQRRRAGPARHGAGIGARVPRRRRRLAGRLRQGRWRSWPATFQTNAALFETGADRGFGLSGHLEWNAVRTRP